MLELQAVAVKQKRLDDYIELVGEEMIDSIRSLGRKLGDIRVLHLNSTAQGGGVAELLNSVVPLYNDAGVTTDWCIIHGTERFFDITKTMHNGLQGMDVGFSEKQRREYLGASQGVAAANHDLCDRYDVIIVHDPQPAAIKSFLDEDTETQWMWRCHIDTSGPHQPVWDFLRPYVQDYDAAIFTMEDFLVPDSRFQKVRFIPPAIDPLTPKNQAIPRFMYRRMVREFGIDLGRPLLLQVSRFDPWKDPEGVIEAYQLVKEEMPDIQLALIGSMASDDPEGWQVYETIHNIAEGDEDIYLFTNLSGVGASEVNAFQRSADVVIQKSIREGFGLVVSEALWKGTPVVAGNTGGIPLQMSNGTGGFLVNSVEECAEGCLNLLRQPDKSFSIAQKGRERVRQQFLIPRLLYDHLSLIDDLMSEAD